MFWYEADEETAASKPAAPVPSVEDDAAALAKAIAKLSRPPTQTEARQFAAKFFGKKTRGESAYAKVIDNPSGYGLELKPGDTPAQKILCPRIRGKT